MVDRGYADSYVWTSENFSSRTLGEYGQELQGRTLQLEGYGHRPHRVLEQGGMSGGPFRRPTAASRYKRSVCFLKGRGISPRPLRRARTSEKTPSAHSGE